MNIKTSLLTPQPCSVLCFELYSPIRSTTHPTLAISFYVSKSLWTAILSTSVGIINEVCLL